MKENNSTYHEQLVQDFALAVLVIDRIFDLLETESINNNRTFIALLAYAYLRKLGYGHGHLALVASKFGYTDDSYLGRVMRTIRKALFARTIEKESK